MTKHQNRMRSLVRGNDAADIRGSRRKGLDHDHINCEFEKGSLRPPSSGARSIGGVGGVVNSGAERPCFIQNSGLTRICSAFKMVEIVSGHDT